MIDVPRIKGEAFAPRERIASADLREPRQPWSNLMSSGLKGRVEREVLDKKRSRANEAHVPADDVDQLRKFVEAQAS